MIDTVISHTLEKNERENAVSMDWLSREISRAESALTKVREVMESDHCHDDYDELDEIGAFDYDQQHQEQISTQFTPVQEVSSLLVWANKVDCLSLSKKYLAAFRVNTVGNANASTATARATSLTSLLQIEANLSRTLQEESYEHEQQPREPSAEFMNLYQEVALRRDAIRRHVEARAVKALRSILDEITYPSPDASQFILSFLDNAHGEGNSIIRADSDSNICVVVKAIHQVSDSSEQNADAVMREFVKPIIRRVRHHFILSGDETIPRDKVDKLPHLLLIYLRQLLSHTAPIIEKLQHSDNGNEAYFYQQINGLIQHVLFQRGYFENMMSKSSTVSLSLLVQDIIKYDAFVQECVGGAKVFQHQNIPSLTEKLICKNANLFQWWIAAQHNHATHALLSSSNRGKTDESVRGGKERSAVQDIVRITETFQSLLYSQRAKASLLQQPSFRSIFVQKVVIPTCMFYLNKQHERATTLRGEMDATTIYGLSSILTQWIVLIDTMTQAAQKLCNSDDDVADDDPGYMPELQSMSESFDKMAKAMVEECSNCYVTLLMERSTLASFLMTASHTLSHGPNDVQCQTAFGLEDVHMILQALSTNVNARMNLLPGQERVRDELLDNIYHFLEKQFLEILLDDLLTMRIDGCQSFIGIINDLMGSIMIAEGDNDYKHEKNNHHRRQVGRLNDVCQFLETSMLDSMRGALFSLLEKEDHDIIEYDEVEMDGTIFEQVENMIRSKGFEYMTVRECISLMNRAKA